MSNLERLKLRTGEPDESILNDCLESAKSAILARRYPFGQSSVLEERFVDLQFRIALDLYNKIGAEGQLTHSENGASRTWESSWISKQLLMEVTPLVGVPK